ncbi:MAG: YigZ family protein [Desulfovibrio sp.]|nr:YigZ family protein [Desulfovibrio sp.]
MCSELIPLVGSDNPHTTEQIVRRSRFLAQSCHVANLDLGRAFVEKIRAQSPEATHHCWACVGGAANDAGHAQSSDDGEPHGTAGRPMLQILLHSGISHVCVVVSRWFGGVKLGTGGLVRAYQDAVRLNLQDLPVGELHEMTPLTLRLGYSHLEMVQRALKALGGRHLTSAYAKDITLAVEIPKDQENVFVSTVNNLTGGTCRLERAAQKES